MMESIVAIIATYGYVGVFIFAMIDHTGTPGAVMVAAGLAASGVLNLWIVLFVSILGGLAGDLLLYAIGRWAGGPVLDFLATRKPTFLKAKEKIAGWIQQYGGSVIIWARFVAIIGRYASAVYGMFKYHIGLFSFYSVIGGIVMVIGFGIPTYYIGGALNQIVENSLFSFYLTLVIVVLQIVITGTVYLRKKHTHRSD